MNLFICLLGILAIGKLGITLERNYLDKNTKKKDEKFF